MSLERIEKSLLGRSEASAFDVGEIVLYCRLLEKRVENLEQIITQFNSNKRGKQKANGQGLVIESDDESD